MSMSSDDMLLYLIVLVTFAAVVVLTLGIGKMVSDRQLRSRISQVVGLQKTPRSKLDAGISKPSSSRTADLMESLSRLSLPADGWQDSQLKLKFIRAGFRGQKAPQTYFGIKKPSFLLLSPLVLGATTFCVVSRDGIYEDRGTSCLRRCRRVLPARCLFATPYEQAKPPNEGNTARSY